ncbi:hypothetical protein [Streptomyces alanosinicus]|uniref:Uncharacterized protein n=1 Tax=Streptomyces alanosinicus TaxID=68171 RepID=A0A919D5P1_9ACTN|nr:hypothetical protein [Streptomyces alanosinicus]GHE12263.1 hypothetical protein GCM10010339_74960 [Streptomyces alanosinicus]
MNDRPAERPTRPETPAAVEQAEAPDPESAQATVEPAEPTEPANLQEAPEPVEAPDPESLQVPAEPTEPADTEEAPAPVETPEFGEAAAEPGETAPEPLDTSSPSGSPDDPESPDTAPSPDVPEQPNATPVPPDAEYGDAYTPVDAGSGQLHESVVPKNESEAPEPLAAWDTTVSAPVGEYDAPDPVTAEGSDAAPAPPAETEAFEPGLEAVGDSGDPAGDGSDVGEDPARRLQEAEKSGREIAEPHGIALDYTTDPVSPECAAEFNEAMKELSADYPKVFDGMNHVRTEQPTDPNTLAYALPYAGHPDSGIFVNADAFSDAEAAVSRGAEEESSGFTVPGGGSPKGVFYHEFGHHCAQQIFDSPVAREELNEAVSQSIGRPYDYSTPHDGPTGDAISQLLSDYGSTTPHEMMAEAFTEHKLAISPRPFASAIGGVIDKHLKSK